MMCIKVSPLQMNKPCLVVVVVALLPTPLPPLAPLAYPPLPRAVVVVVFTGRIPSGVSGSSRDGFSPRLLVKLAAFAL